MAQKLHKGLVAAWLCGLACWVPPSAVAQTKSVAVLASEGNAATDALRIGVRDALKGGGFVEGRNFKFVSEVAPADEEQLSLRARSLVLSRPDVLVALSASAAHALMLHTKQIPIVFAGVSDPVQAELVPNWSASGTNVTGVAKSLPMTRRVAFIRQVVPQARRVGVVYNPVDAALMTTVKEFQEELTKAGLLLVEVGTARAIDVASAARSLIGKIDVLQTFSDSNTQTAYPGLVKVANDAKIPLFAIDTASVQAGALGAVVVTDREVGATAGRQVLKILRGTKPGVIAPEFVGKAELQLNLGAAKKQGVTMTDALVKTSVVIAKE